MSLRLGKRPATYDSRDIRYADLRATLPFPIQNLPGSWGHGMDFVDDRPPPAGWGMLGNGPQDDNSLPDAWAAAAGCGDCAWAGPAHEEMQAAHEAGREIPAFSGKTVVEQYAQYSGYDPQTGNNDVGSDVREVLRWRQQKGLVDDNGKAYKIGTYVSLEPGNWQQLREASYLFESVGIGFAVPSSAMDQFNNRQMWSVVPNSPIEGGHYVPIEGHPMPGVWSLITWGRRQLATWNFIHKYVDEVWAYIDFERYNKVTGETAEHYKDVDLEKYITMFK